LGLQERIKVVRDLARRERNVVLMTGEVDVISDGMRTISVANGHALLGEITGSGCTLGTTVAAVLAVERGDVLMGTLAAVLLFDIAAELAADKAGGPGTFVPLFVDALYDLRERSKAGDGKWAMRARVEMHKLEE
ncbi:thiamine biosynthetic bifunctional enzyme, partial [Oleoguttula sp. CCFEE 5521]